MERRMPKKKVLLMGKSGAGKTSMRSIIFANYIPSETKRLGLTIDMERSYVRFLGLVLNLWDCGGQEAFMEKFFHQQRDTIFKNVEVLIYVFDITGREVEKDYSYYQTCLDALSQYSKDAKVFCLVHKMDLIEEEERKNVFMNRKNSLRELSKPFTCQCFSTTIWDETLYQAWSQIVYQLVPNVRQLEIKLRKFADVLDADEILLFEQATFLVISQVQRREHHDPQRFEKVSNIIKQFKMCCSKLFTSFTSVEVRNSKFVCFIDSFTANTVIMVVYSNPSTPSALIKMNIHNARAYFEKVEKGGYMSGVESPEF